MRWMPFSIGGRGMPSAQGVRRGITREPAPPVQLRGDRVGREPVRKLLSGAPLQMAGDDPRSLTASKVFSAAPLRMDGREVGYVYVVLQGQDHDALVASGATDTVLRATLWSMGLVALLGLLAGLAAFRLITRPLRELTAAVRKFQTAGNDSPAGAGPPPWRVAQGERSARAWGPLSARAGPAPRTVTGAATTPAVEAAPASGPGVGTPGAGGRSGVAQRQ